MIDIKVLRILSSFWMTQEVSFGDFHVFAGIILALPAHLFLADLTTFCNCRTPLTGLPSITGGPETTASFYPVLLPCITEQKTQRFHKTDRSDQDLIRVSMFVTTSLFNLFDPN